MTCNLLHEIDADGTKTEQRAVTRKQFLRSALGVSAAALGLSLLSACGGSSGPSAPSPDASGGGGASRCLQNGTDVTINANHGHTLVVTKDDVAAGADKSYDIRGTADHTHTVTVTADEFAQLAADHAIMTTSTVNTSAVFGTHNHPVMVACA